MKHLGSILKNAIESRGLKKLEVAEKAGITAQDLSGTLGKQDLYVSKWEKLCDAVGIDPAIAFGDQESVSKSFSDISVQTVVGPATLKINSERQAYQELIQEKERIIQEKERMIQLLLKSKSIEFEQDSSNDQ